MSIDLGLLAMKLAGQRLLVVGDVMLDEYIFGVTDRVSPEAPVPVVSIETHTYELGGAANAARGAAALGGRVRLGGVVGDDTEGVVLRSLLASSGIEDQLITAEQRPTTTKTRVVTNRQQVVRIDREHRSPINKHEQRLVLDAALASLAEVDAVLVSDYAKGVLTEALVQEVIAEASKAKIPVIVDPKSPGFARYRGATLVKPNMGEAFLAIEPRVGASTPLSEIGRRLVEDVGGAVLITLGSEGMCLFLPDEAPVSIGSHALHVYDVTGAGDTVASTLALAVGAGASLWEAASLSALAAAVVVGKVGTALVTDTELIQAVANHTFESLPDSTALSHQQVP